jgi:predicted MPP superfamily phosphohydrolase
MKKLIYGFSYVLISFLVVLVLRTFFPKYENIVRYLFIFLLFDAYLWFSVRKTVASLRLVFRGAVSVLYWTPLAALVILIFYGNFKPFLEWNTGLRVWSHSLLLVLFISKSFPITACLISDSIRLARLAYVHFRPGRKTLHGSYMRITPLIKTGWWIGAAVFIILLSGMIFGPYDFKLTRQILSFRDLPTAFNHFKIVQVSDLHLGSWTSKKMLEEAIGLINHEKPDMIVLTGDLFNYSTSDGKGFESILVALKAPEGVLTILGNHDYGDYLNWRDKKLKEKNMHDMVDYFSGLRWTLLRNSHYVIRRGNDSIVIIGVENWGYTKRFQQFGDVASAQAGAEDFSFKLLLSHDPTHWEHIISRHYTDIDLTLSGHTHGGQVGIDYGGFRWSPAKLVNEFWSGLFVKTHQTYRQYLYVNQGLGTIGYAGRIGIKPEITIFTLLKE